MSQVVPIRSGRVTTAIMPTTIDEVARVAKGVAASGLAPQGMKTEEQIIVAILHGLEVGLPPMQAIQKIAVINGRPSIWGDAVPALLWSHGFRISEEAIEDGHKCTITRPDGSVIVRQFTKTDAETAGLWNKNGPWKQYPARMLQMRARSLAARDGAADVLAGMYLAEEAQDIPVETAPGDNAVDITPTDVPEWLQLPQFENHEERPSIYTYQGKNVGGANGGDLTGEYTELQQVIHQCDELVKLHQIPDLYSDELMRMPLGYVGHIVDQLINKEREFECTVPNAVA